ncbi:outer membrane beta-barrel protein [Adhaeribacter sp. BT258]|uniref:Outer membrane beta-barrel protein n=1 Tax=Adhaeribacter terrigena TaxID=2793070 RepID=A0ABS1C0C1_9BACT|nr:outer membrane beta-barrel protein [Adhaeribacter terrigena]MBK0401960.1 outer membrane beta-barrel protein [Adhaeribacter terrigena]
MKKHIVLAVALAGGLFLAQSEAKAQGAYVKLGGAYNFGVASERNYNETATQTNSQTGSTYNVSYEKVNVNYGKGITAGGTVGYMFNEHVGAELGIGYLIGGKNELKDIRTNNGNSESYESEVSSRMLLLQPALVISAGMEGINPYARLGLVAAKGSVTGTDINMGDGDKYEQETKLSGGWGLGLQAGLGVEFKMSDNMAFFSEVTMNNLSYSPDKAEVTKASYNGKDVLGEFTTNDKETEFVDDYSFNSNDQPSDSEPDKSSKFNMPFSSVGVGVGIKFNF